MNSLYSHVSFNKLLSQYTLIWLLTIILSFDILLRIVSYNVISTAEFMLTLLILFSVVYNKILNYNEFVSIRTIPLYLFFIYLIVHLIYSTIYHSVTNSNVIISESFLANIFEFRVSLLGYFMVFLYWGISKTTEAKLDRLFLPLLKLFAVYTIMEQLLSLAGLRPFFETLYKNAGVVSENLIGLRSLGLYRVWGLVGSTQLLGLVHIFLFIRLYCSNGSKFWKFVAIASIVLSTSKTAYFVFLIIMMIYYYRHNKKIFLTIAIFISLASTFIVYSVANIINVDVLNFLESTTNFFIPATSTFDPETYAYVQGGPLNKMFEDLATHSYLFGKGLTYSYDIPENIPFFLDKYYYITSDYYIISFTQQFGIIGLLLFCLIFFYLPFRNIMLDKDPTSNFFLLVFFFATFHYPPQISKLIMIFVCYALWKVYMSQTDIAERGSCYGQ